MHSKTPLAQAFEGIKFQDTLLLYRAFVEARMGGGSKARRGGCYGPSSVSGLLAAQPTPAQRLRARKIDCAISVA